MASQTNFSYEDLFQAIEQMEREFGIAQTHTFQDLRGIIQNGPNNISQRDVDVWYERMVVLIKEREEMHAKFKRMFIVVAEWLVEHGFKFK